jgi:ABC-type amino acid transport substrate-binding protein
MRWMRRPLLAAVVAALGLTPLADAAAQCLPGIKERGVLLSANGLMGTKPYVWKNDQTGQYEGYEAELFAELAKRLGIPKWDYAITEWTTMIPGLKAERWDIILSGMSVTQERIQGAGINYSNPYFLLYDVVIVEEDSPIKSMEDLKGKTVATTLGTLDSVNAHAMKEAGMLAEVMDFNTFGEPFVALKNKQVDAVVLDQTTYFGMQNDIGGLRTVGEPIYYRPKPGWEEAEKGQPYVFGGTAIGVRQECEDLRTALNEALTAMDADGTRQKILEKYGVWSPEQAKLMH